MKTLTTLRALAPLALLCCSCVATQTPDRQVSVGFLAGGNGDSEGSILASGVELPLGKHASVNVEATHYDYEVEDGALIEKGDGTGVAAELRYYPRQTFDGFYVAGGVGVFPFTDWSDNMGDSGDDISLDAHGALGWMFRISEAVALTPTIQIGNWINAGNEAGFYAGAGLRLSFGF